MNVYSYNAVRVFCVLFFSLSIDVFAGAKLDFVTVETKGVSDDSAQEAINAAITEAIGQVNGKSVAAKNAIDKKTVSISDGTQKSRRSATEMQRRPMVWWILTKCCQRLVMSAGNLWLLSGLK